MRQYLLSILLALVFAGIKAQDIVPNQVMIQLTDDVKIEDVISKANAAFNNTSDIRIKDHLSDRMNIWLISHTDEITEQQLVDKMYYFSGVLHAQLNHTIQLRETVPNDTEYETQWQHQNVDSELAWDITTGGLTGLGDEIVVCVIEGGNLEHVDLQDNAWTNTQEIADNGIDDDENGYIDDVNGWNVNSEDDEGVFNGGHGTSVMGMIGAKGDNDMGVAGANWNVKIMSVAGENIGNEASLVEAYDYPLNQRILYDETGGTKGAFVVSTNASWGIDGGNPEDSPIWCGIYETMGEGGILNCGATANNNVDIDVVGDLPTGCSSDYMISVTATNNNDVRTFSAYGQTTIDLGAPGDNIYTTSGSNGYTFTSGTSFASPMTAGIIGLLYSVPCASLAELAHTNPQAAADLVRQALFDGVDQIDNLTTETVTGGRVNSFNSLNILLASCDEGGCFAPFSSNQITDDNVSFAIEWAAFNPENTYGFRYKLVSDVEWTEVLELTEPTYDLGELEWCEVYEYQIKTFCNDENETDWTASTQIETDGCCVAPDANLTQVAAITETSATVSWESVLAAVDYVVTYESASEELEANSNSNSLDLGELEPCTEYTVTVSSICGDGTITTNSPIYFTTMGCGHCTDTEFCLTETESTDDEWIEEVVLNGYINQSGSDGGYGDYTGSDITLNRGNLATFTVTPGFGGQPFNESVVLWIDFDQDGNFEDDEIILSDPSTTESVTEEVLIPITAELGLTRLRASVIWSGDVQDLQDPCGDYGYGETEDYCVTIDMFDSVDEVNDKNISFDLYPNPAENTLSVSLNGNSTKANYIIYDATGREIMSNQITSGITQLDISSLTKGTYFIQVIRNGEGTDRLQFVKM